MYVCMYASDLHRLRALGAGHREMGIENLARLVANAVGHCHGMAWHMRTVNADNGSCALVGQATF